MLCSWFILIHSTIGGQRFGITKIDLCKEWLSENSFTLDKRTEVKVPYGVLRTSISGLLHVDTFFKTRSRRCGDAAMQRCDKNLDWPFLGKKYPTEQVSRKKKKNMMTRNHPTAKKLNGRSLSKEPENCFIVFDSRKWRCTFAHIGVKISRKNVNIRFVWEKYHLICVTFTFQRISYPPLHFDSIH